jgi:hypothetical protein
VMFLHSFVASVLSCFGRDRSARSCRQPFASCCLVSNPGIWEGPGPVAVPRPVTVPVEVVVFAVDGVLRLLDADVPVLVAVPAAAPVEVAFAAAGVVLVAVGRVAPAAGTE